MFIVLSIKVELSPNRKDICYYLLQLKDTWSNNGRNIIVGIPVKYEGAMSIIRAETKKTVRHINSKADAI